tara:strand:+ start:208 stop:456 length:249 start_codon:yes stop_codon:yes gene_type:complete
LKVFYFSWIREYIGVPQEDLTIRSATVRGLIDELTEKGPRYKEAFKDTEIIRIAVDQILIEDLDFKIDKAKEVAFFPPMTGG